MLAFGTMSAEGGRAQRIRIQKGNAYESCTGESLCQM